MTLFVVPRGRESEKWGRKTRDSCSREAALETTQPPRRWFLPWSRRLVGVRVLKTRFTLRGVSLELAEECGDGVDYSLLLVFSEFREDGQSQDLVGGAFGLRKVAGLVAEAAECVLQVQGHRVVDF